MLEEIRQLKKYYKDMFLGDYEYHLENVASIDVDLDPTLIKEFDPDKFHVFDFSDEPWGSIMAIEVDKLCNTHLKRYLILSHCPTFLNNASNPNIIYFPHNYYDCSVFWSPLSPKLVKNSKRKYFMSCLNRMPRYFRIYNYFKLQDKGFYINDILMSLHNIGKDMFVMHQEDYKFFFDIKLQKKWETHKKYLPNYVENDLDIQHPAYSDAYINLVTETNVLTGTNFFSEKIYKPIASGQLFILIGNPGSIELLRRMGFDTFDDIIDHDRYDYVENWKKRIDIIHDILDELRPLDWQKIYKDTYHRRKKNIDLFFSGKPVEIFGKDVAKRMTKLSGQSIIYNYSATDKLKSYNQKKSNLLFKIKQLIGYKL